MSAVQSHIQAGPPNSQFPFAVPDHEITPFKAQDVPRAMNPPHIGGQLPTQQQSMLNLYGGHQQLQQPSQSNPQFQQVPPQQQQQQPQGPHPALGMMPPGPGLVANNGGQPGLPHQSQLQHAQQRVMIQQRLANTQLSAGPGPFPPGGPAQMRRISAQPPPHPQGAPQIPTMGMQGPQQPQNAPHLMGIPQNIPGQLRQSSLNARMLSGQPQQQGLLPEMAMAMGRHQQQQQQQQLQQQPMMNGIPPVPLQRTASGSQPVGTMHQISHLPQQQPPQQQQHRTPFQQQGPLPPHQSHSSSPTRPSSHPSQAGTPGGGIGGVTPTQRPQQTSPEHMFMGLPQQQPQQPQQVSQQQQPMFPGAGPQQQHPRQQPPPQFSFLPQESIDPSANRPQPFHITPAQQLQQLQQGQESFAHVMMQHGQQRSGPSRPEPGPSRSPRPPSRHPHQNPAATRPPPTGPHMQPILPATSPHHRRVTSAGAPPMPPEVQAPVPPQLLRPIQVQYPLSVLGWGQGINRLLGFSAAMANEKCDRLKYDHWNKIVTDYFAPQAMWKLTLWKDNERREAKPFDIGPNVIAMLLLVSCQSGVRSMSLALDGARERVVVSGTVTIECPDAQWIWRFYDGHVIILRGTFACQISAYHNRNQTGDQPVYTLKFDSMNFDSNSHERYICVNSIRGTRIMEKTPATTTQGSPDGMSSTSSAGAVKAEELVERALEQDSRVVIEHALLPPEPINAFGIPQASMRCLELAESVGLMTDLFAFGWAQELGPQDALQKMAIMIRGTMGTGSGGAPPIIPGEGTQAVSLFGNGAGVPLPPQTQPQPQQQPPQPQPPQPQPPQQPPQPPQQQQQQPVPAPAQQQAGPSSHSPGQQQPPTPSKGPSVSAPSGPTTALKRKAAPEPAEPPNKRVTRRKSKAGGAG